MSLVRAAVTQIQTKLTEISFSQRERSCARVRRHPGRRAFPAGARRLRTAGCSQRPGLCFDPPDRPRTHLLPAQALHRDEEAGEVQRHARRLSGRDPLEHGPHGALAAVTPFPGRLDAPLVCALAAFTSRVDGAPAAWTLFF